MAESLESDSIEKLHSPDLEPIIESLPSIEDDSNISVSLEGSVVASPSIESFSTLPEGESSISLADSSNDLVVRVDNPQKQADLLETYITFRVSTKTSRENYESPAYSVRRRYNDFVWLRQHLIHAHPTHFIPALPAKHSLIGQLDRYGREFVAARMAALQVFLNRVVSHPILSFAPCCKVFLTATSEEFQEMRKLTTTSLLTKVSDSLKSLSTIHIETARPPELNKLYNYLGNLSDKLNHLCLINQRIRRERSELVKDLNQLKPAFEKWAGSDPDLTESVCKLADACGKCGNNLQTILIDNDNILVNQPLKEYVMYVDAVKETLDRRDELEVEMIYRRELVEKKRQELTAAEEGGEGGASAVSSGTGGGLRAWIKTFESRDDRIKRLTTAESAAVISLEEAKDRLECANENIRADTDRWMKEKQSDLKNILLTFTDQHMNYYQQCAQAWTEAAANLK